MLKTHIRCGLVPFVDLAYQGFGDDLDTDAAGLRLLARRLPTLLLAISCSKNFGLYRERAGAFAVVAENAATARAIATYQARIGRRMYSMPPDHGAAIAARVLADAALQRAWADEVAAMVARMKQLRALLAGRLGARRPDADFSWLTRQKGMFSLLGLPPAAIAALRDEEHVYRPPDGQTVVMLDLFDYKSAQTEGGGAPALSKATQREYDCQNKKSQSLKSSGYSGQMGAGNVVRPAGTSNQWSAATQGTATGGLLKAACGNS